MDRQRRSSLALLQTNGLRKNSNLAFLGGEEHQRALQDAELKLSKAMDTILYMETRFSDLQRARDELFAKFQECEKTAIDNSWGYAVTSSPEFTYIPAFDKSIRECDSEVGEYVLHDMIGKGQSSEVRHCTSSKYLMCDGSDSETEEDVLATAKRHVNIQNTDQHHHDQYHPSLSVHHGGNINSSNNKQLNHDTPIDSIRHRNHAVKIICKESVYNIDAIRRIEHEIHALRSLSPHPNIVRFYEAIHATRNLYIITERFPIDLFDFIESHQGRIDSNFAACVMRELLAGAQHMFTHGIVHRDLKPENILIRVTPHTFDVRICDFGLCEFLPPSATAAVPLRVSGAQGVEHERSYVRDHPTTGDEDVHTIGKDRFSVIDFSEHKHEVEWDSSMRQSDDDSATHYSEHKHEGGRDGCLRRNEVANEGQHEISGHNSTSVCLRTHGHLHQLDIALEFSHGDEVKDCNCDGTDSQGEVTGQPASMYFNTGSDGHGIQSKAHEASYDSHGQTLGHSADQKHSRLHHDHDRAHHNQKHRQHHHDRNRRRPSDAVTQQFHTFLTEFSGSPGFFAPEVLLSSKFCAVRAEIFSLGCIALELLSSQTYFHEQWVSAYSKLKTDHASDFSRAITQGIINAHALVKSRCPGDAADFIMQTLQISPNSRSSISDLHSLRWVTEASKRQASELIYGIGSYSSPNRMKCVVSMTEPPSPTHPSISSNPLDNASHGTERCSDCPVSTRRNLDSPTSSIPKHQRPDHKNATLQQRHGEAGGSGGGRGGRVRESHHQYPAADLTLKLTTRDHSLPLISPTKRVENVSNVVHSTQLHAVPACDPDDPDAASPARWDHFHHAFSSPHHTTTLFAARSLNGGSNGSCSSSCSRSSSSTSSSDSSSNSGTTQGSYGTTRVGMGLSMGVGGGGGVSAGTTFMASPLSTPATITASRDVAPTTTAAAAHPLGLPLGLSPQESCSTASASNLSSQSASHSAPHALDSVTVLPQGSSGVFGTCTGTGKFHRAAESTPMILAAALASIPEAGSSFDGVHPLYGHRVPGTRLYVGDKGSGKMAGGVAPHQTLIGPQSSHGGYYSHGCYVPPFAAEIPADKISCISTASTTSSSPPLTTLLIPTSAPPHPPASVAASTGVSSERFERGELSHREVDDEERGGEVNGDIIGSHSPRLTSRVPFAPKQSSSPPRHNRSTPQHQTTTKLPDTRDLTACGRSSSTLSDRTDTEDAEDPGHHNASNSNSSSLGSSGGALWSSRSDCDSSTELNRDRECDRVRPSTQISDPSHADSGNSHCSFPPRRPRSHNHDTRDTEGHVYGGHVAHHHDVHFKLPPHLPEVGGANAPPRGHHSHHPAGQHSATRANVLSSTYIHNVRDTHGTSSHLTHLSPNNHHSLGSQTHIPFGRGGLGGHSSLHFHDPDSSRVAAPAPMTSVGISSAGGKLKSKVPVWAQPHKNLLH